MTEDRSDQNLDSLSPEGHEQAAQDGSLREGEQASQSSLEQAPPTSSEEKTQADSLPEKEQVVTDDSPAPGAAAPSPAPPADTKKAKQDAKNAKLKDAENLFPFSVTVGKVYDGPLDLLLDLIRKQDIDIWDIPIARITAQFLAYVEQIKEADVDNAGEFIYTASLLIQIKSRMLLPRSPVETAEEAQDPRLELVERLLEHERFKNAAQMLAQKQLLEAASWTKPNLREFLHQEGTEQEVAADVPDLVRVFRDILDRARTRPVLDVQEDAVTVGQMIDYVRRRLVMEDRPISLRKLLGNTRSERAVIAMFLALLELVRLQAILLRQDANFGDVYIKKQEQFEQVLTDRLREMRDDWS